MHNNFHGFAFYLVAKLSQKTLSDKRFTGGCMNRTTECTKCMRRTDFIQRAYISYIVENRVSRVFRKELSLY